MSVAVDVVVDVLALAVAGVRLLIGLVDGVVPPKPAPTPAAQVEVVTQPTLPDLPLAEDVEQSP